MDSSLPKAILFDLDDTIIAFGAVSMDTWLHVCEIHVGDLPGWTAEQLVEGINSYREWFWSDPERHKLGRLNTINVRYEMVRGAFSRMGIYAPRLANLISEGYIEEHERRVHVFPGALETLKALNDAGVPLALLTNGNKASQRGKINRFNLEPYFDCILVEEEFGVGKPDERVYLHALEQLGAQPSEAWIVGDNLEWEVAAPQRLGITAIWHDHTGKGLPKGSNIRPDRIIRSLPELLPPSPSASL